MKFAFVGPSLSCGAAGEVLDRIGAKDISLLPPAKGGDVLWAVDRGAVAVALIDGEFGTCASVLHKEILYGLSLGVRIAGAASLGALRAAECAAFGMVGIGVIYQRYASGELEADDAVALVHAPKHLGYQPLSDPLVTIEANIEAMVCDEVLSRQCGAELVKAAQSTSFAKRSLARLLDQLDQSTRARTSEWLLRSRLDPKALDGTEAIRWLESSPWKRGPKPGWRFSETVAWSRFRADRDAVAGQKLDALGSS